MKSSLSCLLVVGALVGWSPAHAAADDPDRVRLLTSHVDIRVTFQPEDETNKLAVVVRDDDVGRTYRSNEVALVAVEASRLTLPPGTLFGEEGNPFWVLPQSQNPGLLYLGLSGEAMPAGRFATDRELRLIEVRGPGHFYLWQAGAFGGFDLRMNSADGIAAEDQVQVPVGGHAHYNWGFTTNGTYEVPASSWEDLGDPLVAPGLPGDTERVLVFDGAPVTTARPVCLRLEGRLD